MLGPAIQVIAAFAAAIWLENWQPASTRAPEVPRSILPKVGPQVTRVPVVSPRRLGLLSASCKSSWVYIAPALVGPRTVLIVAHCLISPTTLSQD
jgi:hypothetical protein